MKEDLAVLLPEMVLLTMSCIVLIADLYLCKKGRWVTCLLSQLAIIFTAFEVWHSTSLLPAVAFQDQFVIDGVAQAFKLVILGVMFFIFIYSQAYLRERDIAYGEFHALALFSTLGMLLLVSASSTLMIYLGLELLSLPLYALVALQRNTLAATEAGMKYFVMGALASGMLLYGISLLYGLTGSIQLPVIAQALQTANAEVNYVALFASLFIIAGLAFKLGAVPFHMWIPDIYQGAATNITLLIGTAPKVAAVGMAYRLLHDLLPHFSIEWTHFFVVMALLSLATGNILAIAQTNIKRLLGYSTIAHVGFLLLGFLAAPTVGYTATVYYIFVYVGMTLCAFGVLLYMSQQNVEVECFEDLKGLAQRNPWMAFLMMVVAFSLAGVPPTVGFYAKFMILNALIDAGWLWLAVVTVVFSVIGAYYYLRIVKTLYFDVSEVALPTVKKGWGMRVALSFNGMALLLLGIFPAPLFMACKSIFS